MGRRSVMNSASLPGSLRRSRQDSDSSRLKRDQLHTRNRVFPDAKSIEVGSMIFSHEAAHTRLLTILAGASYEYRPENPVILSSGKPSNEYINCKTTALRGEAMPLIGGL